MRHKFAFLSSVSLLIAATPALAQSESEQGDSTEIIVTAQRTNEKLQNVPIAVSAFNAEALDRQQIKNTSDLQLTLPNITFTKTNFTGASFTIRGIGDLCVGVTCDSATAIHMNDGPLFDTRLFEGEFYDLAQIEVLRGPQGTLFGRNATSGVVNIRTAKPDLTRLGASGEAEYGNYNSVKLKGMINVPLTDRLGVRVAGFYLNRDGYTKNLFDNSRIDGRDMFGLRGSLRFEPRDGTEINLTAQYFHERDSRLRSQKQVCQRDPTAVLGCLNATRNYELPNYNASLSTIPASREFFAVFGLPAGQAPGVPDLSLGSIYGPDSYANAVNPADPRVVNSDYSPRYFAKEWIVQGSLRQELGSGLTLKLQGNWQSVQVDSGQDFSLAVLDRSLYAPGLTTLQAGADGNLPLFGPGSGPAVAAYLRPIANALIPNGPGGVLCSSVLDASMAGVFGGHSLCSATPQEIDRSVQTERSWTGEAILSSDWDGKFNFLLGGIYGQNHVDENSYYVSGFAADYAAGLIGSFVAAGAGLPPGPNTSYALASSMFRNNTDDLKLKTYGLFGEAYYKFDDRLKLTLGLRYNHDEKDIRARSTFLTDATGALVLLPTGSTSYNQAIGYSSLDFDAGVPGVQEYAVRKVKFGEWTGRAVLDFNVTPDNLLYASYSRGYKSGGINPPLQAVFAVPDSFKPEFVNAFEIGSKNKFGNITLNLTGFYYQYKDLQLARIVARTAVNDNVSANIWGLEAEAVIRPTRELTLNLGASYLHTEVSEDKFLSNPRDFGGGRADAVIIKDITNAANCAVGSNSGSVAGVNGFVNQVNALINAGSIPGVGGGAGLHNTAPFPANGGIASTGAFSICSALDALAGSIGPAFGGVTVYSSGIPVNIKGNKLPGAPDYKFSAGAQYAAPVGTMTLTPRVDFVYTGKSSGNIFNGPVNEVPSYTQVNAQVQLEGPDSKWFVRAYVQNLFDKNSITGLYLADQSSGNFTNIFTLEPRRYGVAAGVKF